MATTRRVVKRRVIRVWHDIQLQAQRALLLVTAHLLFQLGILNRVNGFSPALLIMACPNAINRKHLEMSEPGREYHWFRIWRERWLCFCVFFFSGDSISEKPILLNTIKWIDFLTFIPRKRIFFWCSWFFSRFALFWHAYPTLSSVSYPRFTADAHRSQIV